MSDVACLFAANFLFRLKKYGISYNILFSYSTLEVYATETVNDNKGNSNIGNL